MIAGKVRLSLGLLLSLSVIFPRGWQINKWSRHQPAPLGTPSTADRCLVSFRAASRRHKCLAGWLTVRPVDRCEAAQLRKSSRWANNRQRTTGAGRKRKWLGKTEEEGQEQITKR